MPFTTKEARRMTDAIGPQVVGDKCFIHYRDMLARWRKSTRWTTAHEIYKDVMISRLAHEPGIAAHIDDSQVALELAWQVFFSLIVIPYEKAKQIENGDI